MKVKDYFISENNEQDCYHISELISSDENIENFSKYLTFFAYYYIIVI